ncbi:ketopantoate reductase-like protein [Amanita rubescens]|nr:ketopantoate reductase-like protein [Amanita rubescens]
MHFHIVGLGAVGRLISHHLRRTIHPSNSISIIHRTPSHARRFLINNSATINIERDGVLTGSTGYHSELFEHKMSYSEGRGWVPDLPQIESLIVVTKAHQVFTTVQGLLPRLSPNATIVLLQNGMGVYENLIHKLFPNVEHRPHFVLCSNTHGVFIKRDVAVHTGVGRLEFGIVPDPTGRDFEASLPQRKRTASMEELRVSWNPTSEMHVAMRRKLVVNAAINTLTALMGCRNGEILRSDAAKGFIMKICMEAERVFAAEHAAEIGGMLGEFSKEGFNPDDFNVDRLPMGLTRASLYDEVLRVAGATYGNISSMLLDVRNGKPTELEYITGYLLMLGQTYGVRMKRISALHYLIKARCEIPQDQIL